MYLHKIAIPVILILLVLISFRIPGVKNSKENGENNFQIFSENMNLKFTNISCSHDSDGNGYVSCTGVKESGDLQSFECSSYGSERYTGNCKVALPKLPK
jgi:hypothetical protein